MSAATHLDVLNRTLDEIERVRVSRTYETRECGHDDPSLNYTVTVFDRIGTIGLNARLMVSDRTPPQVRDRIWAQDVW